MLGISQEELADALDLSFQQVQKYEKGANRIGASRLEHISRFLQVPVAFFFEGASDASGSHIGFGGVEVHRPGCPATADYFRDDQRAECF